MKHSNMLLIVSICLAAPLRSVLSQDWPHFLGPHANGHSEERLTTTDWIKHPPKPLWSVPLHDDGYAAPASAMGKLFIVDHEGDNDVVLALDLYTGKEAWRYAYSCKIRYWYGYSYATPAYDQGKLYTLSRVGQLHCLDACSGSNVWSCNLITNFSGKLAFYGMVTSPVIDGDRLIVCPGGRGGVVAMHKITGKVLWTSPNGEPMGHSTPVVATLNHTRQYLMFTGLNLLGLRATDGQILWRYPWKTQENFNTANPVPIGTNEILITSTDNGTALLRLGNKAQFTEVWRNRRVRGYFGTPLVHNGWVFIKDDSQYLVCLDLATRQEKWRQSKYGSRWYDSGGLLLGDKILVTNGRTGDLYLVAATGQRYQQLAALTSPVGPDTLPAPILSQGILILRSRSQLTAFKVQPTKSSSLAWLP